MEHKIGRKLTRQEQVHHINELPLDNRLENLLLCANSKEHHRVHAIQDMLKDGADPETEHYCTHHKTYHLKSEFSTAPKTWSGLHNMCRTGTNEMRILHGLNKNKFDWKAMSNQQYRRALKKNTEISWLSKEGSRL